MKPSDEIFVPLPKIKKVASDLVPYLSVPEGWKEQEFFSYGQEFFKFLGLRTELDIEALKYLLKVIQKQYMDFNLKSDLSRIYQALGKLLEEENESELSHLNLLTEDGGFEDPTSTSLYWNDDRDLGSHFQGAEGLRFAWIPDGVERRYTETLFHKTGVKALSKHVQREVITPPMVESNEEWTDLFQMKARYIYSLLKHHKADKADIAGEKLSKVQAKSPNKLEVLLSV